MSTQLHLLEGKIFIHNRVEKQLHITHSLYRPACAFECIIKSKAHKHQNFLGHFIEVHCKLSDDVCIRYIHKDNNNHIVALFNISQQVLHLHPLERHVGLGTIRYHFLPALFQFFCFCNLLLFSLFSIATFLSNQIQLLKSLLDSLKISLLICTLLLFTFIVFGLPILFFKYRISHHKLSLLGLSEQQMWEMQKNPSQDGIYKFPLE